MDSLTKPRPKRDGLRRAMLGANSGSSGRLTWTLSHCWFSAASYNSAIGTERCGQGGAKLHGTGPLGRSRGDVLCVGLSASGSTRPSASGSTRRRGQGGHRLSWLEIEAGHGMSELRLGGDSPWTSESPQAPTTVTRTRS